MDTADIRNKLLNDKDFDDLYTFLSHENYTSLYVFRDILGGTDIDISNNKNQTIDSLLLYFVAFEKELEGLDMVKVINQFMFSLSVMCSIWNSVDNYNDDMLRSDPKKAYLCYSFDTSWWYSNSKDWIMTIDNTTLSKHPVFAVDLNISTPDKNEEDQHLIVRCIINEDTIKDNIYLKKVSIQFLNANTSDIKTVTVAVDNIDTKFINDKISEVL